MCEFIGMEQVETALILMTEYVHENVEFLPEESFTAGMMYEVDQLMKVQFETVLDEVYFHALYLFTKGRTTYRRLPVDNVDEKIRLLRQKPQPVQRTPEWYEYRHKLITASSAYKALGTDAKIRELVKSKQGSAIIYTGTNTEGPMHWGVKYEPVSIQYYTYQNQTQVEEFGCIAHDTYFFLGASPDGINVLQSSPLYGRMLEVKNPFSREINGNPKKEYWIQCQLQLEVCNLEECDFLETSFKEYESEEAFHTDGTFQKTSTGQYKGIILQFFSDKVIYEYAPFQCTREEFDTWEQTQLNERTWVRTIYWRLEEISCVLIRRNPEWFKHVVPQFEAVMKLI
jgi:putative phage-type endonuclease